MLLICKITLVTLSLIAVHLSATEGSDAIFTLVQTCCKNGFQFMNSNKNCENYEASVSSIQPLWFGLCKSTFGFCCLQEYEKHLCLKGRIAAMSGIDCHQKSSGTVYEKCCEGCQIGLAVKKSQNECTSPFDEYPIDVESFQKCCSVTDEKEVLDEEETVRSPLKPAEEVDGEIVLENDDDDICGKVSNLCEHICLNTEESYRCMCRPGFKLDGNGVTCSIIDSNDKDKDGDLISEEEEDDDAKTCAPGYKYDVDKDDCIDIDECEVNVNQCKINQYCHNTIGSYRCLNVNVTPCKTGYHLNTDLNECEDYNECQDAPCEEGYVCVNFPGGYDCKIQGDSGISLSRILNKTESHESLSRKCGEGFRFASGQCVDVDECKEDLHNCGSHQMCTNTIGGFTCSCKIGFNLDSTSNTCLDINECSINNHNCLTTQRCDNTIGSYICTRLKSCGTGYTLNTETNICDDDDECELGTHNCPHDYDCVNTKGFFRCYKKTTTTTTTTTSTTTTTTTPKPKPQFVSYSQIATGRPNSYHQVNHSQGYSERSRPLYAYEDCGIGFYRNIRGACVDVNECVVQRPCASHQRCINTNGSYKCQNYIECPAGYRASLERHTCEDIDECATGENTCLSNQICQNKVGGYVCSCLPGFRLTESKTVPNNCVDINECEQSGPSICPLNSYCRNTIGSYHCECKPGFQRSGDNENLCLDVDECQTIQGLCQQKCVNFWGGYRCTCQAGFELGYDNRTCNDIDECEVHKAYKPCMGYCNNVPGSYECSCPRGYTLALDKSSCRDVDECATGNFCTSSQDICVNTRGSFRCHTIRCPYGYEYDAEQKNRCRIINNLCEGEDCYSKPSAYTYNFITLVSKILIPPEGRTIFTLRGPHWYDDIDFDLKLIKIQGAANIEKATQNHFKTLKGRHEVSVILMRSLEGPQDIELELSMTVFTNGMPRGKSIAKIFILVSQYSF